MIIQSCLIVPYSKLLELCKNFNLRILNVRLGNDSNIGDFTCIGPNGKSTIDYSILTSSVLPKVKEFTIDILDKCLSDKHKTIVTVLQAEHDCTH